MATLLNYTPPSLGTGVFVSTYSVYCHENNRMTLGVVVGQLPGASKVAQGKTEVEGKSQESKAPAKRSKGHAVLGSSKTEDNGRAASGSGNGAASLSAESGTHDSLDASDDNNNLELASSSKKGSFHQLLAEGVTAQNNDGASIQTSVLGKLVVSIAATNLCPLGDFKLLLRRLWMMRSLQRRRKWGKEETGEGASISGGRI